VWCSMAQQQHPNQQQPPAQRPTTLPPLPPRPRDQPQPHARVPRQQQQQQQYLQQQHARPQQQQQRPSSGHASSSSQWGWWRQAGQRALLGLDLVRLPLLQQHAAATAQRSGAPDASSSEAILQRLCVLPQHQQQHVASSRGSNGSSTAARAECWRQLLSLSAAASRQQMVPSSWGPPGQPQQVLWQLQQQQQRPHALASSGGQRAAVGRLSPAVGGLPTAAAQCDLQPEQQQDRADVGGSQSAGRNDATEAATNSGPKPPKRTWQPKMAPDEPNWDKVGSEAAANARLAHKAQCLLPARSPPPPTHTHTHWPHLTRVLHPHPQAAFAGIQARLAEAAAKGSGKLPRSLPEHSTATFAMLMLLHSAGWPNHLLWERWQAAHPPGSLTMFVHMKVGNAGGGGGGGVCVWCGVFGGGAGLLLRNKALWCCWPAPRHSPRHTTIPSTLLLLCCARLLCARVPPPVWRESRPGHAWPRADWALQAQGVCGQPVG
jgi:hypothetical protein